MIKAIKNMCYINGERQISWHKIGVITFLYFISTVLVIGRTELIRTVFNLLTETYERKTVAILVIEIIVVFSFAMAVNAFRKNYLQKCRYHLWNQMNEDLLNRNLQMTTWKNNATDTSDRYVILDKEVKGYVEKLYSILPLLISWSSMLVLYTVYLCSISPIAVFVTIFVELILWNVSRAIQMELSDLNMERRQKYREWFVFLQGTFENSLFMRTSVNKEKYCKQYEKKAMDWNDASVHGLERLLTIDQMQNVGGLVIDVVLLIIGLVNLFLGKMDFGAVYALIVSVQTLKNEFKKMPELIEDVYITQSHKERINQFYSKNRFVEDGLEEYHANKITQKIELKNMFFCYNEQKKILEDFNYTFEMGKLYAVVGNAGTGKTTLLLLIAKLLDFSKGTILFDGQDVTHLERSSLWKHISYVSKPCFVKGTIQDNIALGKTNYNHALLKKIGAEDPYLMQHPFENEQGDSLSAGEKQRLLIYRSVCSECEILLLDEPFSNLDQTTEEKMMQLLLEAKAQGKCIIFTTHRMEHLPQCDAVIEFRKEGIVC